MTYIPINSCTDSISAYATGGQANATQLTTNVNRISTCATAGDSVKLQAAFEAGQEITVINDGAARADVYPASGDTIEGLAADTAVQLLPGQRITFKATAASSAWRIVA